MFVRSPKKKPEKNDRFRKSLERKARGIAQRSKLEEKVEFSQASVIEHEIALALEHMDQLRINHEQVRESLLTVEVYTDNELMSMEARTPRYSPYRFAEREKLQRRLLAIEHERRGLTLSEGEKNRTLHDKLLELVQKHRVLSSVDEPATQDRSRNSRRKRFRSNHSQNGRTKNFTDT